MIAKIISHGADRSEARGRLICGLEQDRGISASTTNQGFLISCLRHPGFAKGEANTAFIATIAMNCWRRAANQSAHAAARGFVALRHQSACAALAQRT